MNLSERKELLERLGTYMLSKNEEWQEAKHKAYLENHWFVPEFTELSTTHIAENFLRAAEIDTVVRRYHIPEENIHPRKVGIVMAGNIPLVGFHDLFCVFLSGHHAMVKPSSKDEVLIKHLVEKMKEWNEQVEQYIVLSGMIRHCDAYIATGSNNSSRYFEYYFGKYPNIIRKNRTSVAILSGRENKEALERLADDVYQYFGLGCRNVTKIFVPKNYDFIPLLEAFKKYDRLADHHKYKNNYDYNLAVHILNNQYYMTNGSIILVENTSPFSRISQLHYEYYENENEVREKLKDDMNIQCVVGEKEIEFGRAQFPQVCDYADGTDTMDFLMGL
ncbi:MAG: acyl-CoA reductase [Flavisolibacter sp.]